MKCPTGFCNGVNFCCFKIRKLCPGPYGDSIIFQILHGSVLDLQSDETACKEYSKLRFRSLLSYQTSLYSLRLRPLPCHAIQHHFEYLFYTITLCFFATGLGRAADGHFAAAREGDDDARGPPTGRGGRALR